MIKKIKSEQLKPGMYLHDLDCGWFEVPFLRRSFMISDDGMIRKIMDNYIREVYIDTARGVDVSDAPTAAEVKTAVEKEIRTLVTKEPEAPVAAKPFHEEIKRALVVKKEAQKVVTSIMADVKLGKQIDLGSVDKSVDGLVESVFSNTSALMCLSNLKNRDEYTFQHCVNVSILMIAFCKAENMYKSTIKDIATGALLHDLGKMKIDGDVLNKNGKLSEEEFRIMKSHVILGKESINAFNEIPESAAQVLLQHHERHDGSGYPNGLKGDEISQMGQIASIVDVYDALTSDRCYHKGMSPSDALRKLYEWSSHHFRKELVEKFIRCVGIYPVGSLVKMESGHIGIVLEPSIKGSHLPKIRIVFNPRINSTVPPKDIDMSDGAPNKYGKIMGYESVDSHGINPMSYLALSPS